MTTTHLITAEEFLEMGIDGRFELIEGVLQEVSPSSARPGVIGARILTSVMMHVDAHGLGFVTNADAGYILNRDPYTVVAPDVGFIRRERLPAGVPERGFFPIPPDLAVEVISPTDARSDMQKKQELYAQAVVRLVWWVDPERRTVTVHKPGAEPQVLHGSATLDGQDVLPGFGIELHRIFQI
ncbi:MAG: Uma2 family endonuclease [Thermomicrobiales bacterium]|nr:Uma2 family endonuclease [Thermomicrobiales bacterium]